MSYAFGGRTASRRQSRWRLVGAALLVMLLLAGGAALGTRLFYLDALKPVNAAAEMAQSVTIPKGAALSQIARQLKDEGLIKNVWAFTWYANSQGVHASLQAGTYSFSQSKSVAQIVAQLSHGKVKTDLVAIVPGQRLDQIRTTLVNYGFNDAAVAIALDPATYSGNPALADKPPGASLEGYIYPDSYQKNADTDPKHIVESAIGQMDRQLTPSLRKAYKAEGLSTYQAITLASIVEKEVSRPADRAQVAQVFLRRMSLGIRLDSDVTAFYGARLAGHELSVSYDSPYNTRLHEGLPPTPISNVTVGSLQAVAHPAKTNWLYFVSGDDGKTYFAHTLAEHHNNVVKHCIKLCSN